MMSIKIISILKLKLIAMMVKAKLEKNPSNTNKKGTNFLQLLPTIIN
jgi:hypothetical protein